jgi:membrane protein implicated in regulation of membrane protease activity
MVDILLWLGDRLEIGIPVVLAVALAALILGRMWRARRGKPTDVVTVEQGDAGQLVVMDGNRVRGDMRVSQKRS